MKRFTAFACLAALVPVAACATTTTTTTYRSVAEDDYRISVEIPLDGTEFTDEQILRVNELLDERTEFDSTDFQLDEVVLVARSEGATGDPNEAGRAELLVLEWRSGAFDIPAGSERDWYEVRIPAPDDDPGGAWLLDVSGDVTVDFLVVVMEPRARVVAEKTVYRTRTVYRTVDGHRHAFPTYWIYDPTRYYVYHYYNDLWPYRYFTGVWDFRYYHVGFRPHYHRFGVYHGPHYDTVVWRDRYRPDRRRYRHGRDAHAWRLDGAGDSRPRARYDELKRSNVRLRTFHNQDATAAARPESPQPGSARDSARARYEEAKRKHPRLRQFHRNRSASENAPGKESPRPVAGVQRPSGDRAARSSAPQRGRVTATRQTAPRAATPPASRGLGNDYGASRRSTAGESTAAPRRIPTLRSSAPPRRPAAGRSARPQTTAPAVSPRLGQGASRRAAPSPRTAAPTVRQQPRASRPTSGNVRSRTFNQPAATPVRRAATPARRAAAPAPTVSRPTRASTPRSFERAAPSRSTPVRSAPSVPRSAPAAQSSSSNPRSRATSRR